MFGFGFTGFSIMFTLVFILVACAFVYVIAKNISQWSKNNASPRLTVDAIVVAKRTDVSHHMTGDNHMHASTTYYVTFQVESGDRMELHVSSHEYGMLAEGDCGRLTFQGTRYLGFERGM